MQFLDVCIYDSGLLIVIALLGAKPVIFYSHDIIELVLRCLCYILIGIPHEVGLFSVLSGEEFENFTALSEKLRS